MPPGDDHSTDRALPRRLDRVEESQLFLDRTAEQLGTELAEVSRRVLELARRIAQIEARLGAMAARVDELNDPGQSQRSDPAAERPPHSAGRPLDDDL
jgi:uncharacterized coiled-coil protein SlyX